MEAARGEGGNGTRDAGYGIEIASTVKPHHRLISVYHGTDLNDRACQTFVNQIIMIFSFRNAVMTREDATESEETVKIFTTFHVIGYAYCKAPRHTPFRKFCLMLLIGGL